MTASGPPPSSSRSVVNFETNLRALANLYTCISLDEAIEMLTKRKNWRQRCIVLTFDDSLKCIADVALPVLVKLGLTATFYISTEAIDNQKPYWWMRLEYAVAHAKRPSCEVELPLRPPLLLEVERSRHAKQEIKAALGDALPHDREKVICSIESGLDASLLTAGTATYPYGDVMTWDDVRRLQSFGMTIGSHTVTHPNMNLLTSSELYMELEESRKRLETEGQGPCRHLCYPTGFHSTAVIDAARACGYTSAVTTSAGWNGQQTDVFSLKRFAMPEQAYKLPYLLSGAEDFIQKFRSAERSSG
jgi:peptidoglycan/xylan/chitin deacetylase (PgdA/CDA1 family)